MKKTIVLIFILASTTIVNGQVFQSIGIKTGVTIANQTWNLKSLNRTLDTESRNGFYGALTFDFFKSKYLSMTTDLGYYVKGNIQNIPNTTIEKPEGDGTYKSFDTKFDYFVFSPMLKVRYETTRMIPYALLGFRLDNQLSYRSDFNYDQIENDFKKTIWGTNLGAGLEYKTKQLGILFEGQYLIDFSNIIDSPSSSTNSGIEVKNRAIVLCIGMKYYLQ